MERKRDTGKRHRSTGEIIDILEIIRNDVAYHLGDDGENLLDDFIRTLREGKVPSKGEEDIDEDDFV